MQPSKKLFIGLPVYAQIPAQFLQCVMALAKHKTFETDIRLCQGDGVARSRNQLTADFLESDCTHMLMIDCDLIFNHEQVARMLSHDEPVVGGLYPKKQEGTIEWVLNASPRQTKPDERGLQEVSYIGTGFMMIQRQVIEKMRDHYGDRIRFTADYGTRRFEHDFWPMGVYHYPDGSARYLSEDWYFCQRWLDLGGRVLADVQCILKHLGPACFPLLTQQEELFARSAQKLPDAPTAGGDTGAPAEALAAGASSPPSSAQAA